MTSSFDVLFTLHGMAPTVLSPTKEFILFVAMVPNREWDFSKQLTDWGFVFHILRDKKHWPPWLVVNLQQTQVACLLGSHVSSLHSAKIHIPFPVTTHSLTPGQGGSFLHPFEVTASAALWTPWQWAFGDSCCCSLLQQPLHLTWQWPCVLPGSLGGRPILLSPGLPPSVLLGALNWNRMVVDDWKLLNHHYLLITPQLLNSAKGVRTPR